MESGRNDHSVHSLCRGHHADSGDECDGRRGHDAGERIRPRLVEGRNEARLRAERRVVHDERQRLGGDADHYWKPGIPRVAAVTTMRRASKTALAQGKNLSRGVSVVALLTILAACDGATEPVGTATLAVATKSLAVSATALVGTVETEVADPPTVRVTDQFGGAVQNIEVVFTTIRSDGLPVQVAMRTGAGGIANAP